MLTIYQPQTSYDYGAAIAENRWITSKYQELKRQGLFLRSAKDFITTDVIGNSTDSSVVSVSNSDVYVTYLKNPSTGAGFYIARHTDSTSKYVLVGLTRYTNLTKIPRFSSTVNFKLGLTTSSGKLEVPTSSAIVIPGRRSHITVTDFTYGSSKALYSTAPVLFAGKVGSRDVLYLYGEVGATYEAAIQFNGTPTTTNSNVVSLTAGTSGTTLLLIRPTASGLTFVSDNSRLIVVSSTPVADTFWSPAIDGSGKYASYWSFGSTNAVLVWGPQLIRDAKIQNSRLSLTGDLPTSSSIAITVIAPSNISSITLNNKVIKTTVSAKIKEVFTAKYYSSHAVISLPSLSSGWKYFDSLPEVKETYVDQKWTTANKTTTNSPFKPYYGSGPVLYGCDYGL